MSVNYTCFIFSCNILQKQHSYKKDVFCFRKKHKQTMVYIFLIYSYCALKNIYLYFTKPKQHLLSQKNYKYFYFLNVGTSITCDIQTVQNLFLFIISEIIAFRTIKLTKSDILKFSSFGQIKIYLPSPPFQIL